MAGKCIKYSISYKGRGERLLANIVDTKTQANIVKKQLTRQGKDDIRIKKRNLCK